MTRYCVTISSGDACRIKRPSFEDKKVIESIMPFFGWVAGSGTVMGSNVDLFPVRVFLVSNAGKLVYIMAMLAPPGGEVIFTWG